MRVVLHHLSSMPHPKSHLPESSRRRIPLHTPSVPISTFPQSTSINSPQHPFTSLTNHTPMSIPSSMGAHAGPTSLYSAGGFTAGSASAWSVHNPAPIWSSADGIPRTQTSRPPVISSACTTSQPHSPPPRPLRPCIPLPSEIDHYGEITLHPALQRPSDIANYPRIDLREPATSPRLPSLSIIHPMLPWAITVHRSEEHWVIVADVLAAIGKALQTPLDQQSRYEVRRYLRNVVDSVLEQPGAIRLDLLGSRHRFAGLSRSSMGGDIFLLHPPC